jgi:high affinity sulfate transporter 1
MKLWLFPSLWDYQWSWLRSDIGAGLAVAAVGLPSAIAYPAIAGLPPEAGIYACIAPMIAYACLGPSRTLIVGPDAAVMTVLAAAIAAVAAKAPAGVSVDRTAIAAAMACGAGFFYLAARALRLGVVASFLSRPILIGFLTGISLSILIGQIGRVTSVDIESSGLLRPIFELIRKADLIHWPTVLLAAAMFAVLQTERKVRLPVPGPVLVLVLSILLSKIFDLQSHGIAVVGNITAALPSLSLPSFAGLPLDEMVAGSAAIFLVSFGAGIITARSFGARAGYAVDPNRELVGLGAANIAASLVGAIPVGPSDSRTAVNLSAGGHTQVTALAAAASTAGAVVFLAPALRILPIPALGAILASTAIGLIDLPALRRLWSVSRTEFGFALIAMWGPISLGVLAGVLIAIAATLIHILRRTMFPRDALLGRVPGRDGFYKLHRTPEAQPVPGLVVFLIQGDLLFFNADYVQTRLRSILADAPAETRWLLLDAGAMAQIDSTGAEMFLEIAHECGDHGLQLALAELHAEARDIFTRVGVIEYVGPAMVFDVLDAAYQAFLREIANPAVVADGARPRPDHSSQKSLSQG